MFWVCSLICFPPLIALKAKLICRYVVMLYFNKIDKNTIEHLYSLHHSLTQDALQGMEVAGGSQEYHNVTGRMSLES